jgi:hypothetical protein
MIDHCVLCSSQDTSELECAILTTLYFASVENTDSWCTRKGDLQRALPLDIPMVHSSTLIISTDDEPLTCGGFSIGETICFESLESITNCFNGLSLSPIRKDSGAAFMVSTHNGPSTPLWAIIEDSTEGFYTASSGERGSVLPSSRRHDTGALYAPIKSTPWMEDAPATQAIKMVPQ